jgi:hypothetical protein
MIGGGADGPIGSRSVDMDRIVGGVIAVCSAALMAALVAPAFRGEVFVYNDLKWFHLPLRYLYQQALQAGDSVLWTPSIYAGTYLHGEGQMGMFHPLHQLLYRLLPLAAAFNVEIALTYVFAFAGMCWFLRRLRFGYAAALFGAMLFAFSGFNLLHHHHINLVAVVAHMPWLLASADTLMVDDRRRARTLAFAGIALIVGSELLLGFPQGVWWNLLTLGAFTTWRAATTGRWRQLLPCAAAIVLGVLLGGIQLLPSAETAAHSTRMAQTRDFALTYSLHPWNLIQLWSPYFFDRGAYSERDYLWFHELGIYSGAILPVSLLWVWIRRRALSTQRSLIIAATIFAAVMLALALGRYGGLAWLLTYIPGIQSFRAPARYILHVQFALTLLAAAALDDLVKIASGRRASATESLAILWLPAALGVLTTLTLNSGLLGLGPNTFATMYDAAPGVAAFVAITLLVYCAAHRMRWAIAALVVFTAVDLAAWGVRFIYREPPRTIESLTDAIPAAPADPAQAYASAPENGPYSHNVLILRGYRLTSGYVGLFPATVHPLDGDIAQRLSGTRWIFEQDGSRRVAQGSVDRVRLIDDQGHVSTGVARLETDRPGHLVAEVESSAPRVLALTERFHNGWSVAIDGRPLQTIRVEEDFLGCMIEPGRHRVEFRFMPWSFVYGRIVSAVGVALLALVLIVRLR